jgi:hypothetical protein
MTCKDLLKESHPLLRSAYVAPSHTHSTPRGACAQPRSASDKRIFICAAIVSDL